MLENFFPRIILRFSSNFSIPVLNSDAVYRRILRYTYVLTFYSIEDRVFSLLRQTSSYLEKIEN